LQIAKGCTFARNLGALVTKDPANLFGVMRLPGNLNLLIERPIAGIDR
jgi:hypothetical protein